MCIKCYPVLLQSFSPQSVTMLNLKRLPSTYLQFLGSEQEKRPNKQQQKATIKTYHLHLLWGKKTSLAMLASSQEYRVFSEVWKGMYICIIWVSASHSWLLPSKETGMSVKWGNDYTTHIHARTHKCTHTHTHAHTHTHMHTHTHTHAHKHHTHASHTQKHTHSLTPSCCDQYL